MDESILTSVKKDIGIDENYTAFDHDIITQINMALFRIRQLGVISENFTITDSSSKWSDVLGENLNKFAIIPAYVKDCVQLAFDPPANSFLVSAIEKRIEKYESLMIYEADPVYE